ncbi:MAG: YHS domain-containing protein [Pseudomonadota bacterium]|nr:YHS domain-containing protein [Pseudomonadota bacterium]
MKSPENLKNNLIDPVCGMAVDPKHANAFATLEGSTYYFCAEGCRKAFEANPEKHLKGKHPKRKGWWGRYLARLEKATGGKSFQCH